MSDANQPLDHTTLGGLLETLIGKGLPVRHARQLPDTDLAGLYQIGYTLYQQAQTQRAETVFRFLCLQDHLEARYWLGLGACRQALGEYRAAIAAYSQAALLAPEDPNLPFYAGCCYQSLERPREALQAFQAARQLAGEQPRYQTLAERAELLAATVSEQKADILSTP